MSNSLRPHGLYSPWNSPGQNTGVGSPSLLQGTFPTQGSNPGHPHCRRILYQLSHKGCNVKDIRATDVQNSYPAKLNSIPQKQQLPTSSSHTAPGLTISLSVTTSVTTVDTSFKWDYTCLLEKAVAPHSSTLAWKIPRTEEPGRLQSMGSLRVRHD